MLIDYQLAAIFRGSAVLIGQNGATFCVVALVQVQGTTGCSTRRFRYSLPRPPSSTEIGKSDIGTPGFVGATGRSPIRFYK